MKGVIMHNLHDTIFHTKTSLLQDFHTCMSVPLTISTEADKAIEKIKKKQKFTNIKKKMEKKQKPDLILAYSIIKYKYISEISKEIQSDCKVYAKHFPGGKTKCMLDCMKPFQ